MTELQEHRLLAPRGLDRAAGVWDHRLPELIADTSITSYAETVFGHLRRADQRRWAAAYVLGLLTTPGRKSVRRLAAQLHAGPTAAQSLHQFANASPWDWDPARHELLRLAESRTPVRAWTVGVAVLPKRGSHSCGVHQRFERSTGRTVNCQVGIGLFLSSDSAHVPVDWRLRLPKEWHEDDELRARTRVPDDVRHCSPTEHVLHLVDSLAPLSRREPVPVVADTSHHPTSGAHLAAELTARGRDCLIAVPHGLRVVAEGRRVAAPGSPDGTLTAGRLLQLLAPKGATATATGLRHVPAQADRLVSALVRLPGRRGVSPGVYRLFARRRPGAHGVGRIWLTSLVHPPLHDLLPLVRAQSGTVAALADLTENYGLRDFEGRSYPGWHHHMTLASAAYAYRLLVAEGATGAAGAAGLSPRRHIA
ncbi:IS701 family transposase [Streptomyces sp. NPDC005863]|uniref:IS701 family transposase n=1 Tax=unclassified Streptomyces TaxID=2593676 RepID=UPI0033F372EB